MKPPKCCSKPAKPFIKRYAERGIVHSIITGFQCHKADITSMVDLLDV